MKLAFAIDAIFPPLTGIGRYAYELANRLPQVAEIDELRFLGMWRWAQARWHGLSGWPWRSRIGRW